MLIRCAEHADLPEILRIYNEGIEDRIATLETEPKDLVFMEEWYLRHQERYKSIVAEIDGKVAGWCALNPYHNRNAYDGVADLSVYIARQARGMGIGHRMLKEIETTAAGQGFHKIVLFTFPFNEAGQRLYRKNGYKEVGVFKNHGILDGSFIDVMAMEKIII